MFYGSARRTRQQTRTRTGYFVPPTCSDSDIKVQDYVLDGMLDEDEDDDSLETDYLFDVLDDDDDSLDPDFQLNNPDDLTPKSSGKQ